MTGPGAPPAPGGPGPPSPLAAGAALALAAHGGLALAFAGRLPGFAALAGNPRVAALWAWLAAGTVVALLAARGRSWGAVLTPGALAWAVWFALGGQLWSLAAHGAAAPYQDDWSNAAVVAGAAPPTWAWLWAPHNEHLMTGPRLARLGVAALEGGYGRGPCFASAALLAAAAAAALAAVARLRGPEGLRGRDALVPLALLQAAQAETVLWPHQLAHALPAALLVGALAVIGAAGPAAGGLARAAVAAAALALPLCTSQGVLYLPGPCAWLVAGWWWGAGPGQGARRLGAAAAAVAVAAGAAVALHVTRGGGGGAPSAVAGAATAVQVLATAAGTWGQVLWPLAGLGLLGLALADAAWAARWAADGEPAARARAAGVAGALLGVLAFAAAVGAARAGVGGDAGLHGRYVTMTAPLLLALHLAHDAAPWPAPPWARAATAGVLLLLVGSLGLDRWRAQEGALEARRAVAATAGPLGAGEPLGALAALDPLLRDPVAALALLAPLHAAGAPPFPAPGPARAAWTLARPGGRDAAATAVEAGGGAAGALRPPPRSSLFVDLPAGARRLRGRVALRWVGPGPADLAPLAPLAGAWFVARVHPPGLGDPARTRVVGAWPLVVTGEAPAAEAPLDVALPGDAGVLELRVDVAGPGGPAAAAPAWVDLRLE